MRKIYWRPNKVSRIELALIAVLALAGPQDARRTGPWMDSATGAHRVLHASPSPPCAPSMTRCIAATPCP